MGFSDEVLTRGKSGKLELRTLHSRGAFVMCKYLNPETLKPADKKTKLTLKRQDGTLEEYFVIPLKDPRRSLLVKAEGEEKNRRVWNEQTQQEEDL
ncbi:MAG: hypothetical protein ABSG74_04170 [Candidatus Bathyarchaeia archaeon]|jgi:hypothetical protein